MKRLPKNSVFKIRDTLTTRAEISDLAKVFDDEVVAIIGLGGTGGCVLDFMVKTSVREIRAYDADGFHTHNAFRSPGRLVEAELGKSKAEVYGSLGVGALAKRSHVGKGSMAEPKSSQ